MSFAHQSLVIAGLACIAVPIVIHLLSRHRRRPIAWGAMRFLLAALHKHRRRLRLETLLLLALRCLIVVVLGAALAHPFLQAAGLFVSDGRRVVYVLIDNGAAGSVIQNGTSALDRHRDVAVNILSALSVEDRAAVISLAQPAEIIVSPASRDHDAIAELIRDIPAGDAPTDIPGALIELERVLSLRRAEGEQVLVYLLSDFLAGSVNPSQRIEAVLTDSARLVQLLALEPAATAPGNVQITSISALRRVLIPRSADGSGQITIELARTGPIINKEALSTIQLRFITKDGQRQVAAEPIIARWSAGRRTMTISTTVDPATLPLGCGAIEAVIDDDSLASDNHRLDPVVVCDTLRVAVIGQPTYAIGRGIAELSAADWLEIALHPDDTSPTVVERLTQTWLGSLDGFSAVFITRPDLLDTATWERLSAYIATGGVTCVFPPDDPVDNDWPMRFTGGLHVPFTLASEAVMLESPARLAQKQPASSLLKMLRSEVQQLAAPIHIARMWPIETEGASAQQVLITDSGSALIVVSSPVSDTPSASTGLVVYFAVAPIPEWTDLPTKPFMVPLMHEIVRASVSEVIAGRAATAGAKPIVSFDRTSALVAPGGERIAVLTEHDQPWRRPVTPLRSAGAYRMLDAQDQSDGILVINVDPKSCDTEPSNPNMIARWLGEAGPWSFIPAQGLPATLTSEQARSSISLPLLILLLVLVICETAAARWFSHARRSRSGLVSAGTGRSGSHELSGAAP
ncbi:MAG: BatA domain-containing protein [Phycisphaerales bacterium]|nr:BatA domain-containing protein [Phycisphaerales bacterium]